jgi:hypothetical protein
MPPALDDIREFDAIQVTLRLQPLLCLGYLILTCPLNRVEQFKHASQTLHIM